MIIVLDRSGRPRRFYTVDAHHHFGKEEHAKNLQPNAPGGTFDFLRSLLFGNQWKRGILKEMLDQPDEFRYLLVDPQNVEAPDRYVAHLAAAASQFKGLSLERMYEHTLLVDQTVIFPMNDIYKAKEVPRYQLRGDRTPTFSHSNERISRFALKYPNSLRFIPFGRVCPQEGKLAVEEIERMVTELGMRGLKVHPKTDYFKLDSREFQDVVAQCARFDIPVISHTTFLNDVLRIHDSINEVLVRMYEEGGPTDATRRLMQNTRFILGHCGWHNSKDLYEVLAHPCIYGEISGVKGEVVSGVWDTAKKNYSADHFFGRVLDKLDSKGLPREFAQSVFVRTKLEDDWSRKLMFGTDFPFLDQPQAIDVLKSLFSVKFPGGGHELENILGLNALRIVTPFYASRYASRTRVPIIGDARTCGSPGTDFTEGLMKDVLTTVGEGNVGGIFLDPVVDQFPAERVRSDDIVMSVLNASGRSTSIYISQFFHDKEASAKLDLAEHPPRRFAFALPLDMDMSNVIRSGRSDQTREIIRTSLRDCPTGAQPPRGWLPPSEAAVRIAENLKS